VKGLSAGGEQYMILCEWEAPEGHPGQCCVHLYAFVCYLRASLTSVSIFSVCCYSSVSISMILPIDLLYVLLSIGLWYGYSRKGLLSQPVGLHSSRLAYCVFCSPAPSHKINFSTTSEDCLQSWAGGNPPLYCNSQRLKVTILYY
jgi:hypothetical protein